MLPLINTDPETDYAVAVSSGDTNEIKRLIRYLWKIIH